MQCPMCRAPDSRVIDSRLGKDGDAIRRRRHCDGCGHRFTTYERVELTLPSVVKKDGRRQPFDRAKIVSGLTRACEKRPVSTDTIEALASQMERWAMERGESEITSSAIGEAVMLALHDLDAVAYVRFASVYREFRDVHEFMRELEELIAARSGGQQPRRPKTGRRATPPSARSRA
jgi:transcriptional repressor NrdR